MSKPSSGSVDALPTIYRAYKPIEEYLEMLTEVDGAPPAAAVAPVDALIVHLLVSLCSGKPTLVDLAAEATHGVSTVLCCTQSKARKVVRQQQGSPSNSLWCSVLTRYLDDCQASCLIAPQTIATADEAFGPQKLSGSDPTMIVTTAGSESPEELVSRIRRWVNWNSWILVLALGEAGHCECVKALSAAFHSEAPQRFVLLRERAAALHGSALGLIHSRTDGRMDHLLTRLANFFTGNYSYLNLVKSVCEEAIRKADHDNSIIENHFLGPLAGTRRRIAELEQTLATREQELAEARRWGTELQAALGTLDRELTEVRCKHWEAECAWSAVHQQFNDSLAFKVVKRLQRMRTLVAPDGTLRYRVVRKMLGGVRMLVRMLKVAKRSSNQ